MRTTSTLCLAALASAVALAGPVNARADDPYADLKPRDKINPGMLDPQGYPRPPRPIQAGRFRMVHFDERLERESHHVGNLEVDRGAYVFTTHGQRRVAGLWFTYRYEQGDSLAMLDQMYKAVDLNGLSRVTDDAFVRNLPKDRALIVVPLGSSLMLRISPLGMAAGDTSVVDPLNVAGAGSAANPRAVHMTVSNSEGSHLGPAEAKTYDARVGDAIPLVVDCQLTVKRIVPADEKHNILGWVEFSPVPAGHEAELCKRTVRDLFTYAAVGTGPAFEKALAAAHLRKGLLAPREMRDLMALRPDLERISGPPRLEARLDRGDLLLIWRFDADFRGGPADAMRKFRDSSTRGARLKETKWYYGSKYLTDLQKLRFGGDAHDPWTIFGADHDDNLEFASASPLEPLPGRKSPACRQHFLWAAGGSWDIELPTLRQFVDACPTLKLPPSETPFDDFLGDKQIWSCSMSFADDPGADWSVEVAGEIRPGLESLLAKQGFKESAQAVHVPLPKDPKGAEQRKWQRKSDASTVSITSLDDKIEVGYQGPQRPK